MKEIWKPIVNWENRYLISSKGRVMSLMFDNYKRQVPKILKLVLNNNRYLKVSLQNNQIVKQTSIHRLVAQSFIPNYKNKPLVNHLDGNKKNNNVSNLEWCTVQENEHHATINHLKARGEKANKSFLKEKDILNIRRLRECFKMKYTLIANMYNVSSENIRYICIRRYWDHVK